MDTKEETLCYEKYSVEKPTNLISEKDKNIRAYNLILLLILSFDQTNIFACDKIEDINKFIGDGQNRAIINFEINNTNCDIFYDFLMSLKETSEIFIRNCSSEIIIENICEMAKFIPNLKVIHSPCYGYIYSCANLEEKNLSIVRNKKYKSANK